MRNRSRGNNTVSTDWAERQAGDNCCGSHGSNRLFERKVTNQWNNKDESQWRICCCSLPSTEALLQSAHKLQPQTSDYSSEALTSTETAIWNKSLFLKVFVDVLFMFSSVKVEFFTQFTRGRRENLILRCIRVLSWKLLSGCRKGNN